MRGFIDNKGLRLSPHFTLGEFINSANAVAAGIENMPPPPIIEILRGTARLMEAVRAALGGNPITISSGYRNRAVNKLVGGVAIT